MGAGASVENEQQAVDEKSMKLFRALKNEYEVREALQRCFQMSLQFLNRHASFLTWTL